MNKSLKDVLIGVKKFYKDDYEKIKFERKVLLEIRITDEIKNKALMNKGEEKLRPFLEKIIEKNVDKAFSMEEIKSKKKYEAHNRLSIRVTLNTAEKLLNIMGEEKRERNRIINAILENHLKKGVNIIVI